MLSVLSFKATSKSPYGQIYFCFHFLSFSPDFGCSIPYLFCSRFLNLTKSFWLFLLFWVNHLPEFLLSHLIKVLFRRFILIPIFLLILLQLFRHSLHSDAQLYPCSWYNILELGWWECLSFIRSDVNM